MQNRKCEKILLQIVSEPSQTWYEQNILRANFVRFLSPYLWRRNTDNYHISLINNEKRFLEEMTKIHEENFTGFPPKKIQVKRLKSRHFIALNVRDV